MSRISYAELANRLDNVFLFNQAQTLDDELFTDVYNGEIDYCYVHDPCTEEVREASEDECEHEFYDIYQMFLIGDDDARYLAEHTDEIVLYSNVLEAYVWGVTHFGTSWSGVYLDFKEATE